VSIAIPLWGQQAQGTPPAPVPAQILSAKRVFISNAGEGSNQYLLSLCSGGPNRAYNQFYAALKSWGQYELVSAPSDADLIFEIHFENRAAGDFLRLQFLDPRTHVTLWTVTEYIGVAMRAKNRDKNFDFAVIALVNDVKNLLSPPSPADK
jgi:hypothetical protein